MRSIPDFGRDMGRPMTFLAVVCALFLALPSSSMKAGRESGPQDAAAKIATRIIETTSTGGKTEFLVVLEEQADLSPAFALTDRNERGRYTRDSLYRVAETTQAPLLAWLAEQDIEHRAFYIVNAIWVNATAERALEIAQRPEVARIEANPTITNRLPQSDSRALEDQAIQLAEELRKVSSVAAIEPGVAFTRAPQVWAGGFTGQGIVIAGADTGIKWDHPALKEHYRGWVGGSANHNYNWHDSIHTGGGVCGPNSPVPCDDNGHGTHTVGTAVGDDSSGNQIGVAPGAKFIGCRNMNQGNGTPASYIECMEFFLAPYPIGGGAAQGDPSQRPHITINSWTCPASEGCAPATLQGAVEAQRAAGIMMVVAAGNGGSNCSTIGQGAFDGPPSHYDAGYTVGATTSTDGLIASFSSRGPINVDGSNRVKPDITAPGVNVRSATTSNGYTSFQGTSMATPHVAGAVALLWSAEPALQRQIDQTESLLNDSAVRVNTTACSSTGIPNNVYGFGRLDIKAAVDASRPTVSQMTYNVASNSSSQTVTVTAPSVVAWSSVSNTTWITLTSNLNGVGNGSVTFLVSANPDMTPRSGNLTIAGKTVTVTQAASNQYQVSGTVTGATGAPLAMVSVRFSLLTGSGAVPQPVLTDATGNWSQGGFDIGSRYMVIAVHGRISFSPRSRHFSAPVSTLNFALFNRDVAVPGPFLPAPSELRRTTRQLQ